MTALTIRKSEVGDTGCIRKMGEPCQIWKRVYSSIRVKDVGTKIEIEIISRYNRCESNSLLEKGRQDM